MRDVAPLLDAASEETESVIERGSRGRVDAVTLWGCYSIPYRLGQQQAELGLLLRGLTVDPVLSSVSRSGLREQCGRSQR